MARVLMIEDDEGVRALIGAQLAGRYDFHGVATGEAGIEAARSAAPDVVLLDLTLGGELQGFDVLDAFASDPVLGSVPVIVVTGSADPDTLADTLARGAHDFLGKPYEGVELQARISVAVRTKRLHDGLRDANERLARDALTDELTGLANRRHGLAELARMTAHAVRHNEGFAVVHADIDFFKEVNDQYGHAFGDAVLRRASARLLSALRREDLLVRWGGDEFVALLPHAHPSDAFTVADRLRLAVSDGVLQLGGLDVKTTVSLGWACVTDGDAQALLARADDALYDAKRAGRDTVRPAVS